METNNTEAIPTNKSGFPIEECSRCGGSGHFSYNDVHGTMCFGCGGTGFKVIKKAKPAWEAYKEAQRKMKQCTYEDLNIGDCIAHNQIWRKVSAIALTPKRTGGYSKINDEVTYDYEIFITVSEATMKDGTVLPEETFKTVNRYCAKRSGVVDPAPFLAMIPKSRKKK